MSTSDSNSRSDHSLLASRTHLDLYEAIEAYYHTAYRAYGADPSTMPDMFLTIPDGITDSGRFQAMQVEILGVKKTYMALGRKDDKTYQVDLVNSQNQCFASLLSRNSGDRAEIKTFPPGGGGSCSHGMPRTELEVGLQGAGLATLLWIDTTRPDGTPCGKLAVLHSDHNEGLPPLLVCAIERRETAYTVWRLRGFQNLVLELPVAQSILVEELLSYIILWITTCEAHGDADQRSAVNSPRHEEDVCAWTPQDAAAVANRKPKYPGIEGNWDNSPIYLAHEARLSSLQHSCVIG
ncbi:hypothetical protein FB451DRAFT_1374057 [Mycena latifolia]|nr:hypothetical protein FB451DRAFT_1374057 [Mycena latifolia]